MDSIIDLFWKTVVCNKNEVSVGSKVKYKDRWGDWKSGEVEKIEMGNYPIKVKGVDEWLTYKEVEVSTEEG